MVIDKQLDTIRQVAFLDELEKLGGMGLAVSLLTKALPKLLLRSAQRYGGSAAMKTMKSSAGYSFLRSAGKKGLSFGETYRTGVAALAKAWGPKNAVNYSKLDMKIRKGTPIKGQAVAKPWTGGARLSIGTDTQISRFPKFTENAAGWLKTRPKAWTGELAHNLEIINTGGIGSFVKHEINMGRTFKKGGKIFPKAPLGQVAGAVGTTGIGFGAIDFAAGGTDVVGNKVGLVRRSARASTTAIGWSLAPGLSMGKLTAEFAPEIPGGITSATKAMKRKFFTNNKRDFDFAQ